MKKHYVNRAAEHQKRHTTDTLPPERTLENAEYRYKTIPFGESKHVDYAFPIAFLN